MTKLLHECHSRALIGPLPKKSRRPRDVICETKIMPVLRGPIEYIGLLTTESSLHYTIFLNFSTLQLEGSIGSHN